MKFIGPHLSIAGGLALSVDRAVECGATGFAIFTKNQRQWSAPPISEAESTAFREAIARAGIPAEAILPHDSYLINLGNPSAEKRAAATKAFAAELQRVEVLGLRMLNFHPGNALDGDRGEALAHIAECVRQALDQTESAVAVIENTAGQGSTLGNTLEELQILLEKIDCPQRTGICIDTCHAYAAGIDLSTAEGLAAFWEEFQQRIGLEMLRGMHWNDTKSALGSHLDRHAPIGDGNLGWETFLRLAKDPRLDGRPMILETPDSALWPQETARLLAASRGEE